MDRKQLLQDLIKSASGEGFNLKEWLTKYQNPIYGGLAGMGIGAAGSAAMDLLSNKKKKNNSWLRHLIMGLGGGAAGAGAGYLYDKNQEAALEADRSALHRPLTTIPVPKNPNAGKEPSTALGDALDAAGMTTVREGVDVTKEKADKDKSETGLVADKPEDKPEEKPEIKVPAIDPMANKMIEEIMAEQNVSRDEAIAIFIDNVLKPALQ
jgi:hypothetical protein